MTLAVVLLRLRTGTLLAPLTANAHIGLSGGAVTGRVQRYSVGFYI